MKKSKKDGYKNISNATPRVPVQVADDSLVKLQENQVEKGELVKPIVNNQVSINDVNKPIKSIHSNLKPIVLQNPHMQLYNSFSNYSVCPFCKYTGDMKINYKVSKKQAKYCCILASTGILACCAWIPFIVKDCANQEYQCPNCSEIIQTIEPNKIL